MMVFTVCPLWLTFQSILGGDAGDLTDSFDNPIICEARRMRLSEKPTGMDIWDSGLSTVGSTLGPPEVDRPYNLPEWSYMTRAEGERFTAVPYRIIDRDFWGPNAAVFQIEIRALVCVSVRRSGGVLHPAARLAVEPDLHVDELLTAPAPESRDDVGDRLIPAAAAMTCEKRGRQFA
jgi:hypothetical protein